MKKQTAWQYITRRTGLGRTRWPIAIIIILAVIALGSAAIFATDPAVRWTCGAFAVAIAAIMVGGTISNYQRDNVKGLGEVAEPEAK